MDAHRVVVIAVGSKVLEALQDWLPETGISILGLLPEGADWFSTAVPCVEFTAEAKLRPVTPPPWPLPGLPDWEELKAGVFPPSSPSSPVWRYLWRRALLSAENIERLSGKLQALPKNSAALIVTGDMSETFASALLWDVLAAAREMCKPRFAMALLGLPLATDGGENCAGHYALLKEMHYIQHPEESRPLFKGKVLDGTILADREQLLEDLMRGNEGILGWLISELAEDAVDNLKGFSLLLSASFNLLPTVKCLAADTAIEAMERVLGGETAGHEPDEQTLRETGLDERALLEWVSAEVDALLGDTSAASPQSADELREACQAGERRIAEKASSRFEKMITGSDRPGEMCIVFEGISADLSLRTAKERLHSLEESLEAVHAFLARQVYRCLKERQSLEQFCCMEEEAERGYEAMLRDHLQGTFLPPRMAAVPHSDLQTLVNEQRAERQSLFLRRHFEFAAFSQCLLYLDCFLQDVRQVTGGRLNARLMALEEALRVAEARLAEEEVYPMGLVGTLREPRPSWTDYLAESVRTKIVASLEGEIRRRLSLQKEGSRVSTGSLLSFSAESLAGAVLQFATRKLEETQTPIFEELLKGWMADFAPGVLDRLQRSILGELENQAHGSAVHVQRFAPRSSSDSSQTGTASGMRAEMRRHPGSSQLLAVVHRLLPKVSPGDVKPVESWYLDYMKAIDEQVPVHVFKSIVYLDGPFHEPAEDLDADPALLVALAKACGAAKPKGLRLIFETMLARYWGVLWDRDREMAIGQTQEKLEEMLQENPELKKLFVDRIYEELTRKMLSDSIDMQEVIRQQMSNLPKEFRERANKFLIALLRSAPEWMGPTSRKRQ